MKITLLSILLLLFNSSILQAQEGWTLWYNQNQFKAQEVPNSLIEKQKKLAARNYSAVNCIGLAPDGGWVISYVNTAQQPATPYLSWDGTQKDFMATLQKIKTEGATIQQIVFAPLNTYNKQSWVVLYDNNEANWKNIAPSLITKIIDLNKANKTIKSIGLSINGGWVLIAENNEVFWDLIPEKMIQQIKTLQQNNQVIQSVAFNLDNGWILLYDKNKAIGDKIPTALIEEIKQLESLKAEIKGVNFYTIKGKL
ncbi:hypothetical protein [Aureispira anguillae]|uniref:Uncharacterized protein n=1 Tax=Aureispira anguillae TaxID=2864201 RepID=A0A916DW44_9BACT|nr:hypothetical protein [Aureispira anguillae]BDS14260.1 hypothetical protein AsAng_0050390 [Aureispira anguillae]